MSDQPLTAYDRVQQWIGDFEKSWGPNRAAELEAKIQMLRAFCEFVEKNPDEIIAECLRTLDDGNEKIRFKARHHYIEKIGEFEASPDVGRGGGNAVRSFFIHNGVMMGGRILR